MAANDKATGPGELFYARTFALLTLAIVGLLLYRLLAPLAVPLLWAIFLAFLLQPLHRALIGRFHCGRNLSALLLTLTTLLLLIGPLAALVAAFATQVANLLELAQGFATQKLDSTSDIAALPVLGSLLHWLQDSVGISWSQIQAWMAQGARAGLGMLAPVGGKLFLGALGTALSFVLSMFMLFFLIRDAQQMSAILRGLIPVDEADKQRLFGHLAGVLRAVVYGTGMTAIMQGALVGVGFWILELPAPVVFGALAALFAVVPAAGTPVIWVPAALALIVQQRWGAGAFMLGWGLMLSTADNIVRPYLVAGRAEIGTLAVFIGVLGGISAFGAVGVLAGPVILALVVALIRFTLEMRAERFGDSRPPTHPAAPPDER